MIRWIAYAVAFDVISALILEVVLLATGWTPTSIIYAFVAWLKAQ